MYLHGRDGSRHMEVTTQGHMARRPGGWVSSDMGREGRASPAPQGPRPEVTGMETCRAQGRTPAFLENPVLRWTGQDGAHVQSTCGYAAQPASAQPAGRGR